MIQGFKNKETEEFFQGKRVPRFGPFRKIALRKLDMLDAAGSLLDLRVPPGNRLEPLSGDRHGMFSIRINQRWRICFIWSEKGPDEVEIVDYH